MIKKKTAGIKSEDEALRLIAHACRYLGWIVSLEDTAEKADSEFCRGLVVGKEEYVDEVVSRIKMGDL
jgi:hypothetical protein